MNACMIKAAVAVGPKRERERERERERLVQLLQQ
jgi:hypothetical protein